MVVFQTIILLPVLVLTWQNFDTAGESRIYYAELAEHTRVFSLINLVLIPAIVAANWSVMLKIRQGILQVVNK